MNYLVKKIQYKKIIFTVCSSKNTTQKVVWIMDNSYIGPILWYQLITKLFTLSSGHVDSLFERDIVLLWPSVDILPTAVQVKPQQANQCLP